MEKCYRQPTKVRNKTRVLTVTIISKILLNVLQIITRHDKTSTELGVELTDRAMLPCTRPWVQSLAKKKKGWGGGWRRR